MRHRRRRQLHQPPANSTVLLNLSLFLMLLAFFIVLNGMSSFEEMRYKPIMESLASTFSSATQREDSAPSVTPNPVKSINEGSAVDRLDALFNAQITGAKVTSSSRAGVMHVELPLEEFDQAMTRPGQVDLTQVDKITGLQTYFLPTLVSLMKEAEQGRPYRVDIIVHTQGSPAGVYNTNPAGYSALVITVAGYAALLEKQGLSKDLLSIGVSEGSRDKIEMFFRPAGDQIKEPAS